MRNRGLVILSFVALTIALLGSPANGQTTSGDHYVCGDGKYHTSCDNYSGWRCEDGALKLTRDLCDKKGHGGVKKKRLICGDGFLDPGEECDDGEHSSDTAPNACRSDCRKAGCGDYVVDSGEECDEGSRNNDSMPNQCRTNCKKPVCGDGVVDTDYGEECDDANTNEDDGCTSKCTVCTRLFDDKNEVANIDVVNDTTLCRGAFSTYDYGDEGVIIVKHPGVTVDCAGAKLRGNGSGVGIFVKRSDNVTIKNCTFSGFEIGIKAVDSQNLQLPLGTNDFSDNAQDYFLERSTAPALERGVVPAKVARVAADRPVAKPNVAVPREPQSAPKARPAPPAKPVTKTRTAKSRPAPVKPVGTIVKRGRRTLLNLNTKVDRVLIYAGRTRLVELSPSTTEIDISVYVGKARGGKLTFHYFDGDSKTTQTIAVSSR